MCFHPPQKKMCVIWEIYTSLPGPFWKLLENMTSGQGGKIFNNFQMESFRLLSISFLARGGIWQLSFWPHLAKAESESKDIDLMNFPELLFHPPQKTNLGAI